MSVKEKAIEEIKKQIAEGILWACGEELDHMEGEVEVRVDYQGGGDDVRRKPGTNEREVVGFEAEFIIHIKKKT